MQGSPRLAEKATLHADPFIRSSHWASVFIALWVLALAVRFQVTGHLYGADVLAVVGALALISVAVLRPIPLVKDMKPFAFFVAVWLISQISTDLTLNVAAEDALRGWANIAIFLAALLVAGAVAARVTPDHGVACLAVAASIALPFSLFGEADLWKFALAFPVMLIVSLALDRSSSRVLVPLTVAGIGLLGNLAMGARANGALFAGAVVLSTVLRSKVGRTLRPRSRAPLVAGLAVLLASALVVVYPALAQQGVFGEDAATKAQWQSRGEFGVVIGGRPTTLIAVEAIRDSPVLGHGSWATDTQVVSRGIELARDLGYRDYRPAGADERIPSHSHVLGAWADSGIGGLAAWLGIAALLIRAFVSALRSGKATYWETFMYATIGWDIAFSPFGGTRRTLLAIMIALLVAKRRSRERGVSP